MLNKNQEKNKKRQARNKKSKTIIKNQFKRIDHYLKEKSARPKELKNLLADAQSALDKAVNKKVIHKNKAARKKSKLHKLLQQQERIILE